MAELERADDRSAATLSCCSSAGQETCCEPDAKGECCGPEHEVGSCGCSAGAKNLPDDAHLLARGCPAVPAKSSLERALFQRRMTRSALFPRGEWLRSRGS